MTLSHIDFNCSKEEPRWWNGKIWNSSLLTSSSRRHQQMEVLTEHPLANRGRSWTPKSIRNHPLPVQPVRMKERKRKEKRKWEGTSTSDGGLKVTRGSYTQKSPIMAGKSAGGIRGPLAVTGKFSNLSVGGRTKEELCTQYVLLPCTPQPELCVSCCRPGPDAGKWGLESGCREENIVGCKEKARRDRN